MKMSKKYLFLLIVLVIVVTGGLLLALSGDEETERNFLTYEVTEGELVVDVTESGNLQAAESKEIRSEVEGRTTIISIVDEGTIITEEDIENEKVLVELDSSDLRERAMQEEIEVRSSKANLTEAREDYDIQVNQNESDLHEAEQRLQFARMDIQEYLGEELAEEVIEGTVKTDELLEHPLLAGSSLQRKQELNNDIDFAQEESARASTTLSWTERLFDKDYVSQDELEADRFATERKEVDLQQAKIERELFEKYAFPKEVQSLLSDYEEAERNLERVKAENRSRLSQAESRLSSRELTYQRELDSYNNLLEQIDNCTIKAESPGLITYGEQGGRREQDIIEPGEEVRERQVMLTIPDMSSVIVETQIPESIVPRLEPGQKAEVNIDSLGGMQVEGELTQIDPLPDYQHRWLNPDLKVYSAEITLDETHEAFIPGMSVENRIIIEEIEDTLHVPLQSVTTVDDQYVSFVVTDHGVEQRTLEVGDYDDTYMEIKDGLSEGEHVVLDAMAMLD